MSEVMYWFCTQCGVGVGPSDNPNYCWNQHKEDILGLREDILLDNVKRMFLNEKRLGRTVKIRDYERR